MMSPDTRLPACEVSGEPTTVRVEHDGRGGWSIAMPDQRNRVTCETFDDARRIAYLCAAQTLPCELIVHDAYHRVLHRELIDGHRDARPSPPTEVPPNQPTKGGR